MNRIFGFEPKIARALISSVGSAAELFRMNPKEVDSILGPFSKHKGQVCRKAYEEAEEELNALSDIGIGFIGIGEPGYPPLLTECEDPPSGLYYKGRSTPEEIFRDRRMVSVIGTRDLSPYGKEWCRRIVDGLGCTPERPTIVSGLALGTDICAHTAALEAGLPTIAVLPTGPESIYPYRHREAAERIADTPGCALITDYPPGTAPLAIHFLRRNRIIAGISEATILVESRVKGGGMMTSRLAYSYNRDVYVLPGRIDDVRSVGCNSLIKEKIAEPIASVESLLESLGMEKTGKTSERYDIDMIRSRYTQRLGEESASVLVKIYDTIVSNRGICIDELSSFTGLEYGILRHLTGILEADGILNIDLMQRCSINLRKSR